MCGIALALLQAACEEQQVAEPLRELLRLLASRGPDHLGHVQAQVILKAATKRRRSSVPSDVNQELCERRVVEGPWHPQPSNFEMCGCACLQGLPDGVQLHLAASLLQLRGVHAASAPLQAPSTGSVLCFNGEVFGGLEVPPGRNDGDVLLHALEESLATGRRMAVHSGHIQHMSSLTSCKPRRFALNIYDCL